MEIYKYTIDMITWFFSYSAAFKKKAIISFETNLKDHCEMLFNQKDEEMPAVSDEKPLPLFKKSIEDYLKLLKRDEFGICADDVDMFPVDESS